MAIGGAFLRGLQTVLRSVQFLASVLSLAIFAYFISVFANHDTTIPRWIEACTGISAAAIIYTAFAIVLTCCLGGVMFFAFVAMVLDVCFIGGFTAIAILDRGGAHSTCNGMVVTGGASSGDSQPTGLHFDPSAQRDCRLQKGTFAVAIINIILFIITLFVQLAIGRHHQREKRYGPSPANNYTSGSPRGSRFGRKERDGEDAELGAAALATDRTHPAFRPSRDSEYTGSTVMGPEESYGGSRTKFGHIANGGHGYGANGASGMNGMNGSYGRGADSGYGDASYDRPVSGPVNGHTNF